MQKHCYIDRETQQAVEERPIGDWLVHFIYSTVREKVPFIYKAFTSKSMTNYLAFYHFDIPLGVKITNPKQYAKKLGIKCEELVDDIGELSTARKVFERKIKYWEYRPLADDPVVSPADSRVCFGSFNKTSSLFVKDKFFTYDEILGEQSKWLKEFIDGKFAIFRLTPDKYHYNHLPVSGRVIDFYSVGGVYHSCNPTASVEILTPNSKNRRYVTIIDTDVENGSGVGKVAMIEVVAMMIGQVEQCYSTEKYNDPRPVKVGDFLKKGAVKSLFHPGSSTDILLFQKDRIEFCDDLKINLNRAKLPSRYSTLCGKKMVETDLKVRTAVANKRR